MPHSKYLQKQCSECGGSFWTSRRHAVTCGVNCRNRKMRREKAERAGQVKLDAGQMSFVEHESKNDAWVPLSYLDYLLEENRDRPSASVEDWQNP